MKYKLNFGPVHSDTEHEPLAFIPLITYWVRRFSKNFVYLQLSSFHLKTNCISLGFWKKRVILSPWSAF